MDGLKFDFRIYVLLCGVSPLRLYVYKEGLARFATEPYEDPHPSNLKNQFMHLTNYAVNKKNPKYIRSEGNYGSTKSHKRSLGLVLSQMEQRGVKIETLLADMDDVIVKTILMGIPLVSHQYRFCQPDNLSRNMCFQILGLDIMFD